MAMQVVQLKLRNWRNFKQVDIAIGQRAFFIGPNAAGKSNLLDALRFLRDLAAVGSGGLQEALRVRGGVNEVRSFSATRNANISIEVCLGEEGQPRMWSYLLEIKAEVQSRSPIVVREVVKKGPGELLVLNRPDSQDEMDPARLSQTALQQVNANREFREVVNFLSSIRYLHVVPQIVRDPHRSGGANDPFGGDLIERINATSRKARDARLKRMEEALRVAVPQLSNLEIEVDAKGVPHLRARYNHWRPQGAWQREERFSDGTLRLLGLIWALQERGGPLLLEEPEMSLNPGVVARLAPLIGRAVRQSKRQVLITTHSTDLLSDAVSLAEVHLLHVDEQGTSILSEPELDDVRELVNNGVPLGEAIFPKARSRDLDRLPLLDLMMP